MQSGLKVIPPVPSRGTLVEKLVVVLVPNPYAIGTKSLNKKGVVVDISIQDPRFSPCAHCHLNYNHTSDLDKIRFRFKIHSGGTFTLGLRHKPGLKMPLVRVRASNWD